MLRPPQPCPQRALALAVLILFSPHQQPHNGVLVSAVRSRTAAATFQPQNTTDMDRHAKHIRVVHDALTDMLETITSEEQQEVENFHAFGNWCSSELAGYRSMLEESTLSRDTNAVSKKELEATIQQLESNLRDTHDQEVKNEDIIQQEQELDRQDDANYERDMTINSQSQSQISKAVDIVSKVLRAQNGPSFLQGGAEAEMQLKEPGESSYILGIMKRLRTSLQETRTKMMSSQRRQEATSNALVHTKTATLQNLESDKSGLNQQLSQARVDLAETEADLRRALERIPVAEQRITEIQARCDAKSRDWEVRRKDRADEKAALQEAISFLEKVLMPVLVAHHPEPRQMIANDIELLPETLSPTGQLTDGGLNDGSLSLGDSTGLEVDPPGLADGTDPTETKDGDVATPAAAVEVEPADTLAPRPSVPEVSVRNSTRGAASQAASTNVDDLGGVPAFSTQDVGSAADDPVVVPSANMSQASSPPASFKELRSSPAASANSAASGIQNLTGSAIRHMATPAHRTSGTSLIEGVPGADAGDLPAPPALDDAGNALVQTATLHKISATSAPQRRAQTVQAHVQDAAVLANTNEHSTDSPGIDADLLFSSDNGQASEPSLGPERSSGSGVPSLVQVERRKHSQAAGSFADLSALSNPQDASTIKQVVNELQTQLQHAQQQQDDLVDSCRQDMDKKDGEKTMNQEEIERLLAAINLKNTTLQTLSAEVASLSASLATLQENLVNATAVRTKERDSYVAQTRDRKLSLKVVAQTMRVLKRFYASKDVTALLSQQQGSAPTPKAPGLGSLPPQLLLDTVDVSEDDTDPVPTTPPTGAPPPVTWSRSTRQAMAGEGVLRLLEKITEDLTEEQKVADREENDAVAAYERLREQSREEFDATMAEITERMKRKARLTVKMHAQSQDEAQEQEELGSVQDQIQALHQKCDQILQTHKELTKARDFEVSQLRDVLDIVSGSQLAVRTGTV